MMQITFIRHGEYNKETGLLTDTGIEQMTCSAMVLQDISDKQRGILRAEPFHPDPNNPSIIVPQLTYSDYLNVWGDGHGRDAHIKSEADPDLIITSTMTRAMQSGFVLKEQLKKMGLNVELETAIPFFDELKGVNFDGGHGYISEKQLPEICKQDSIQDALKYFKKLEEEGHRHIVVVTHQPNIQALGYAICGNRIISPPQNGDLMAIYSEAGLDDQHRLLFNHCRVNVNTSGDNVWKKDVFDMAKKTFQPLPSEKIKEKLKEFTNGDIEVIKENLLFRAKTKKPLLVRIPLIHFFNCGDDNATAFAEFFNHLQKESDSDELYFEILTYHEFGKDKYEKIGKSYAVTDGFVTDDDVKLLVNKLKAFNLKIVNT